MCVKKTKQKKKHLFRKENIVGKGENGGYQHFLFFLQCFQKACMSALILMCLQYKSFLKTLREKEKLLVTSNFSFSQCFLPSGELSVIVIKFKIVVCKLFQFEESKICHLGKGYSWNSVVID